MIKIILDPGHGAGEEFNRGGVLFNEGDQNYKFSLELKKALEEYSGLQVFTTRKNIKDNPTLKKRGLMYTGDLFISLHTNAASPKTRGAEIFLSIRNSDETLARRLLNAVLKVTNTNDRGVKRRTLSNGKKDYYGVLRYSKSQYSVLIEHVFHTNITDSKVYLEKQKELAKEEAKVIADYYGLKKKNYKTTTNTINSLKNEQLYQITVNGLNIRSKPTTESGVVGFVSKPYIYTIVEKQGNWGKLKSGKGWIYLKGYTRKVEDTKPKKSIEEIAKEVINGKYGNGNERKIKLEQLGYNYKEVQQKVNELLK